MIQRFGYFSIKSWYKHSYMSKYNEQILSVLSKSEIKSTNEVLTELQKKAHKIINWHALYRVLMELQEEGKIERLKSKAGIFWKKK